MVAIASPSFEPEVKHEMNVLIVSGHHFADSPRKVDLHFIAEQLLAEGARVDFLICRLSPFSRLINDGRYKHASRRPFNTWLPVSSRLEQLLWLAPFHPINLKFKWLNVLISPIYHTYAYFLPNALIKRLPVYSHVMVESGPSPLLTRQLRKYAPNAKFIYNAADRLSTINVHPLISRELANTVHLYDTIRIMADAMRVDFPLGKHTLYLPHGIKKEAFDVPLSTPYGHARQAVSVGDMMFDKHVVDVLAQAFPDWTFHLFGKNAQPSFPRSNVVVHGEVAFDQIVPYIKFADIGLALYRQAIGIDYLSQSSLKMIQYTYCQLPIVAPQFASAGRSHVCSYQPGDVSSIVLAFAHAATIEKKSIDTSAIRTWQEVVRILFAV